MSLSRPTNDVPHHVLDWLNHEKDPFTINQYLNELRKKDYAVNLNLDDPASVICHALTTHDLNDIHLDRLKEVIANAKVIDPKSEIMPPDPVEIIKLIIQALELIIKIIEASDLCKKPTERETARLDFVKLLREQAPYNPFINLPGLALNDADLTGANLQLANFKGSDFKRVNLHHAKLDYANLRQVTAKDCNFDCVKLSTTNLSWSNLERSQLPDCGPLSLKTFVQSKLPSNVRLNGIPTPAEIKTVLNDINDDLESERINEHIPSHKLGKKFDRQHFHNIVSANLAKIAKQITVAQQRKDFLVAVINHPFYAEFGSAPIVKDINKALIGVHDFFSCQKRDVPYFGAPNYNGLVKMLNQCNKEIDCQPLPRNHHHHHHINRSR